MTSPIEFGLERQTGKRAPRAKAPAPKLTPRPAQSRASKSTDQELSLKKQLNEALFNWIKRTGNKKAELARCAGFSNANRFTNLHRGHSQSLSVVSYVKIAQSQGVSVDELLGLRPHNPAGQTHDDVVIRARAQTGLRQSSPDLPFSEQYPLNVSISREKLALGAYGVELMADNYNGPWQSVTLVLPFRAGDKLYADDRVIVHRHHGAHLEVIEGTVHAQGDNLALTVPSSLDGNGADSSEIFKIKRDGRPEAASARNLTIAAVVFAIWQTKRGTPESTNAYGL